MKRGVPFGCLLLLLLGVSNAQDDPYVDVCAVSLVDLTSKAAQTANSWNVRRLGTFEPVGGEEQRTTKSFKIPGTNLFAVATVFFTDESMAVETASKSNDVSATLELLVSKTPQRDVASSISHAEAEVMVTQPNAARVSMIFKANRKILMLLMEYRTDLRSKLVNQNKDGGESSEKPSGLP